LGCLVLIAVISEAKFRPMAAGSIPTSMSLVPNSSTIVEGFSERTSSSTNQHAAGGVSADTSVGEFHAGEHFAEIITPTLGNRVSEEHDGTLVFFDIFGPAAPGVMPAFNVTFVPTQSAFTGKAAFVCGKRPFVSGGFGLNRSGSGEGKQRCAEGSEQEGGMETGAIHGEEAGILGMREGIRPAQLPGTAITTPAAPF